MSAHTNKKTHILVTHVGTFLGRSLAKSFLDQNCVVYGVSSTKLPSELLSSPDFTLVDVDLAQPLPHYLPSFDLIFDLTPLANSRQESIHIQGATRATSLAANLSQSAQLFMVAPVTCDPQSFDTRNSQLLLVGDVYGPGMPDLATAPTSELEDLIGQATKGDKIILKDEGLRPIYPAYIKDVIFAINRLAFRADTSKKVHVIVSEPAQTSLSIAYEIQNALAQVSDKDVGLFFAGLQPTSDQFSHLIISTRDLEFTPKFQLKEALKETLQYFYEKDQIATTKKPTWPLTRPVEPPALPSHEPQIARHHLPRLPAFAASFNLKKVAVIILAALLITVAKTALDLFLGASSLKNSQKSLTTASLSKAQKQAESAVSSFQAAKNKIAILTFPLKFIAPSQTQALTATLDGLILGSSSLIYTIDGVQKLEEYLAVVTGPDARRQTDLDTPAADFRRAYQKSSQATQLLAQKLPIITTLIKQARESFTTLNHLTQSAYELTNLIDDFTGGGTPKIYLVLLQNNTELRPGGGFIGNFALLEFEAGRLKNITVEDIYTIDGQLAEVIEPPPQLKEKLGTVRFYLRDSNWSLDFTLNAQTARDFFKKETGKNVDGVIALDLSFLQNVLSKTGPITLTDYNEQITADNLFERGEYHSEIGSFPGSTQKRDFFGALTRALITKIVADLNAKDATATLELLSQVKDGLLEKHIMASFDDSNLATFIAVRGWNQPLPPANFDPADDNTATRDFLAISEANLGANKVNRFLKRTIAYEATIGRDADLMGKLIITYTNESIAETWPAGKYVNFLRVYVPFAAGLETVQNGDNTDTKLVEVSLQGPFTVFATYVEVPISSTRQVTFTYRIPKNIKLGTAPTYELYASKQPGTDRDPFEFKFNLPAYLSVKDINEDNQYEGNQNITIKTELSTDRDFAIELAKR